MTLPVLFLCSALALPGLGAVHYAPFGGKAGARVVRLAEFQTGAWLNWKRGPFSASPRVLLAGGNPGWVRVFRAEGWNAFGALTDDDPRGATSWHAVTDPGHLSFLSESVQAVFWLRANALRTLDHAILLEVIRLVTPQGYLIFNEETYPDWPTLLIFMGWEPTFFHWHSLDIWQKKKLTTLGPGPFARYKLRLLKTSA